jgi:hypothetical protein
MYDNNNPMNGQFSSTAKYLSNKHLSEWCEGSAVNEAIARLSIESLTAKQFNERIRPKEPIKTGGWWCGGVNWRTGEFMGTWYGQGKPDKPHHPEGSDERKYLTGSGMEPDAIFLPMPDKNYWAKVHADKSIPRHWAEGVKKGGAGLSLGLAVLALTGVWNWGKDGKLAKFVGEWAQPGTTHYIDFDSDYAAKPSCRAAIIKFAQLLIEHGCTVHITCWDTKFKGLDDLIVGKGGDAFLQAVADAPTFAEWEKSLGAGAKVLNHPKFEAPNFSDLAAKIDQLLESDLRKSQLQIQISELAQTYRLTPAEVWKIYRTREEELEQEFDQEDTAAEVARILASKATSINLVEILPTPLAEAMMTLATTLNLKPEGYTLALFTQVSTLLKASTSTMLYPQTNFRVCPNYFGALVAESSQKKSPVVRAIISDPMEKLKIASEQEFEKAKIAYEEELRQWKADKEPDKGPMPKPPAQKIYHFTTATGEGIAAQVGRLPQQSLLWVADELAGAFKSANQYRGGKGSDEENLLEYWSSGGSAVLRAAGLAVNVRNVGLSIFGNIQPKVLATFLGEGNDDNGKFARFDFVQQPLAATELFEDAPSVDLTPMLTALYERLDALPPQKFELDKAARKLFIAYYNQCERDRISNPKQGMRSMLGKAPEKVGKLATILHCIHSAFYGAEMSPVIPVEIIRAAIKFVKYTTDQALSLNLEICESTALAPSLAKIISLAQRKGGMVSARDVGKAFNSKHRPNAQKIREWFKELVELKYGETTDKGQNICFTLCPQSPVSPLASNQDTETVQDVPTNKLPCPHLSPIYGKSGDKWGHTGDNPVPTSKPLSDNDLSRNGDTGDTKTPFSENSTSLMMSCTTNSAQPKSVPAKKGLRVRYVGSEHAEQYAGLELVVDSINKYRQITCLKPDGRFTTWLKPEDLEAIS